MRVAELFLYPVKGGAAVPVAEMALDAMGPVGDRRFCLARPGGRVFTQRDDASLARLRATPGAREVVLDFDGASLEAPFDTFIRSATVRVWSRQAEVRIAGDEVNAVLTRWFGTPLELARLEGATLALGDAAALLLTNAASLDALNAALPAPVPMARFRPNVVIEGAAAYDEDSWPHLEIGEALLSPVQACGRCEVTTIDQELGATLGPEPLRTLARLRERDGEPVFGVYFAVGRPGRIRVGDAARPAG